MGLSRENLQTIATRTGKKVVAAWSDHNAGAMGEVVGVVMHHTGSAWSAAGVAPTLRIVREGRSDLQNALCTFYIDKAGTIYLVTEKIAWHAGQGYYRGITDGNGHFLGIEAESDGVHWTAETIESYVLLVAEICRFLGIDEHVWAIRHAVWATPPGRKTDFSGINETDFRARIGARIANPEDDMPSFNDPITWNRPDNGELVSFSWAQWLVWTNWWASQAANASTTALAQISGLTAAVDKLAGVVAAGRDDVTADELKQAVRDGIMDAGAALRAAADQGPAPDKLAE